MNADEMIAAASHNGSPQGIEAYNQWVRICRESETRQQREDAWLRGHHGCDAYHNWDGWFEPTSVLVDHIPDTAELQPAYPRSATAWRVDMKIAIEPGHVALKGKRLVYSVTEVRPSAFGAYGHPTLVLKLVEVVDMTAHH